MSLGVVRRQLTRISGQLGSLGQGAEIDLPSTRAKLKDLLTRVDEIEAPSVAVA